MPNDAIAEVALARHDAGRSIGPVAPGMKGPSLIANRDMPSGVKQGESFHIKWKETYTKTRASRGQVRSWFLRTSTLMGIGIFCGRVSGVEIDGIVYGLEVTECDDAETLAKFETLMVDWQYGALLERLVKELTPRQGAHFSYLTPVIEGNQPLARRKIGVDEKGKALLKVLIETRGEHGFIVTSPTPPGIHPTVPERGYEMVRGSWERLPIISTQAREQIFACARALNEYFEEDHTDQESEEQRKTRIGSYASGTPLGDYQARATTASMKTFLERHGYSAVGQIRNGRVYMVRPGKDSKAGHSATLGFAGPGVLHVYSTSDSLFQANKSYSPMYTYTYLEHGGDWKAAQKALAAEGYGRLSTAAAYHSSNGAGPSTNMPDISRMVHDEEPPPPDSWSTDDHEPHTAPADEIHLTDVGNGLRLVQQFGHDLRYVITWRKWLIWHGGRWVVDEGALVEWRAKQVIAALYRWAQEKIGSLADSFPDDDEGRKARAEEMKRIKAVLDWAHDSENGTHIDLMVKRARVNPKVQLRHNQLDVDPMLFQCANGTIDLRTGERREPQRSDYITKQSPVIHDPDAICPRWDAFLQRIQGYPQANESLSSEVRAERIERAHRMITYLKRLVGMSLTSDISAQQLQFLHGTGQNGKSTFLNIVLALSGEYGMQAAPNFLLVREHEQHPTELTDLFGKRFVSTIEIEKGKELAEALMKTLTGSERVRARRMREDFWEFPPTWKVWLAANDKPKVKGRDKATWRRIKLIPFEVTIPDDEVDPDLPQTLLQELPGIMNWAIEGCQEWKEHGLQEPKEVTQATEAYREETDILGQFVHECCMKSSDRGVKTQSSVLHKAFDAYAGTMLSPVGFADLMKASGYKKTTINGKVYWVGIGLKTSEPDAKSKAAGVDDGE